MMAPLITIEVIGNNIVQIAGEYNRLADSNEMDLIKQWAENKGLNISENLLAV